VPIGTVHLLLGPALKTAPLHSAPATLQSFPFAHSSAQGFIDIACWASSPRRRESCLAAAGAPGPIEVIYEASCCIRLSLEVVPHGPIMLMVASLAIAIANERAAWRRYDPLT
jgi:hypothetical protein